MPLARLSPSMSLLKCRYALATLTIIPFSGRLWTLDPKRCFCKQDLHSSIGCLPDQKTRGLFKRMISLSTKSLNSNMNKWSPKFLFCIPFEGFHRFFYVAFIAYELNDLRVINLLMYNVVLCYLLSLTTLLLWPRHLSPHLQRERLFYSSPRLSCSV